MDAKSFYYLVKRMRYAQRQYFKTRLDAYLKESKDLEHQVDLEIERVECILHPKPLQQTLEL